MTTRCPSPRTWALLSKHLSSLRASVGWNDTKKRVKSRLNRIPVLGQPLYRIIHTTKRMIKSIFVDEGFFSALGFRYLGPIDGNNLAAVESMLRQAEQLDEPVVIHCATKKGYGYNRAERQPEDFHGTPPFLVETGEFSAGSRRADGEVAMRTLVDLARKDSRIVAVTAAMPLGTCTHLFEQAFPTRHFDVGIAEEHAVTMCAGMASGGLRPFFFVYSTFLQRGYDQVLRDVCIQNLPVVLMLDRAGISNEDGQVPSGAVRLCLPAPHPAHDGAGSRRCRRIGGDDSGRAPPGRALRHPLPQKRRTSAGGLCHRGLCHRPLADPAARRGCGAGGYGDDRHGCRAARGGPAGGRGHPADRGQRLHRRSRWTAPVWTRCSARRTIPS